MNTLTDLPVFTTDDERWAAVQARDGRADGVFWYSVASTGVYCRPSCPSRPAKRQNVRFHASCADAEAAGFRPCKRCKPNEAPLAERQAAAIGRACRLIEASETLPTLDELAEVAELSRFYFHRIFKAVTGLTPKDYAAANRARRVTDALPASESVTAAIYDAGFNSSGRFYADATGLIGMAPAKYRSGGRGEVIRFGVGQCSLGAILVAATDKGVCCILLGDEAEALVHDLQDRFPQAQLTGGEADFEQWMAQVIGFVDLPMQPLNLPLDVRGTAFQLRVWQALRDIPAGTTLSYTDLAERIGSPKAVRAVAAACAANKIAVAIPCHRVVRNDGALAGYRWGIERKRSLLALEQVAESTK
ncbi:bifunctional DNA-binding transcriptional regulator/O6-methylguanine-DNA methyltransferase Ada [Andreprevotia chitinilytica]|uniref:bifunctional DNA-binding transcriptional regulator/O6-methylguanine-DNA methyltransferase Ada n=1 Tax=Andreprevotia chitinilytica TaxID=396808 RepID=UPI0005522AA8|nr:bifunctional DNA-binding transcriptional regulator/O6-methylguanine-DNA methyltransferase Ada [Andreprevotia chitinilytica]